MSGTIKAAILALKGRIADAYTAISNKGGTLPATQDSANLATAIASIPSGEGPYTGHIDEVGLRAIGWIDRDIDWFKSVINWNAEEDAAYKVPQELIDAYTAAGNTWSEDLSATNASKWWFRYRPRGGDEGYTSKNFANNSSQCEYLIAIPNYETWPWNEVRTFGRSMSFVNVNNINRLVQQIGFWNYCPPVIYTNTEEQLLDSTWGFLRDNTVIREIHGILDCRNITNWYTGYSFTNCQCLRIVWLKNLNASVIIRSYVLAKECLLYMINNEAASSPIVISFYNALYQQYSVDADITAALVNHPNISIAGV